MSKRNFWIVVGILSSFVIAAGVLSLWERENLNVVGEFEGPTPSRIPTPTPRPKYIAPIKDYIVTSRPGKRYLIGHGWHIHYGIDLKPRLRNSPQEPILSTADGVVVRLEKPIPGKKDSGHKMYGGWVEIDHYNGETISGYAHLDETFVEVGEHVVQGQVIGIMGDTGISTAEHLHFYVFAFEPWKVNTTGRIEK